MSSDVPNRILFAQNLPMGFDAPVLTTLFQQCQGFQEVRTVPGNPSIAFIEFGDEVQAGMALRQLQNFQITADQMLHLTFSNQ
jgi:U2 small nuclear ribonucleoprotein B''